MLSSENVIDRTIDRFWETIPPLWGVIRSHIRATAIRSFDVTVEQFHILRYVRRGIGSVSELAVAKNISRPAISQAVEVLVKKGLLSRVQSTRDRRYVELALTEAGNSLLDSVVQETRGWMKERMNAFSSEELQTIMRAMEALKKMLD